MCNYVNCLDRARCRRRQGWRPMTGWRLFLATKLHSRIQSHGSTGINPYWQMINASQEKSTNAHNSSKKQTNATSKKRKAVEVPKKNLTIYILSPEQEGSRPGRNWQDCSPPLPLFSTSSTVS